ncbi:MAG: small ribosomal subunit biogenesis GTPase RsgA, partial [Pseudomonadota bacterium]|nr:small ribosomal subunit biogenesis GTPase RsgA [Pseudomonadota bacterium]
RTGLVVTSYGAKMDIEDSDGITHRCTSRRKHGTIVCGDRVVWEPSHDNQGIVVELLKRDTLLSRPDDIGREKAIAANIDQLIIVTTVKALDDEGYRFHANLIDRYIIAAENLDITPVLVVNKIDLLNSEEQQRLTQDLQSYHDIGYQVRYTSTTRENGLDDLEAQLANHTNVFVGESGVGKSSLISALLPEEVIRIGEVSASSGKGKHTTTTAALYHLPCGANLIDSPGVREFGLAKIEQDALAYCFIEFRPYRGQCKFNNCAHVREPICAIKTAVAENKISQRRYNNYLEILHSFTEPLALQKK